ncbi:DUF202 domain-containing protein [Streptomyces sp. JJ36]|uniref:DUF202 domain-containing protein n=1 Tax=Streptomyces sp. JJ36 TaxID=2736645 RepID=UPI001F474ECA|nr:DUF202 domain-containing protein [Streptomyces sp. JJ36]MCF6522515.1 DUF202 domain-containing protein [Streptomyces sp. JJ36]
MRDAGAQPERTRLAWRRTTLTFAVAAALAVRSAVERADAPGYAAAALGALAWLAFLSVAHRRIRALAHGRAPVTDGSPVQAAAVCALAMTLFGTVLLW